MRRRARFAVFIVSVLSVPTITLAQNNEIRPLVTILTVLPGKQVADTKHQNTQWAVQKSVAVNQPILDGKAVSSDITIPGPTCDQWLGIKVDIGFTHQRQADLTVDLSTVSADGSTVLQTVRLFNGPKDAATGLSDADNKVGSRFDSSLLRSSGCTRWRLTITDRVTKNTGQWNDWTISRRFAWFPYAHDKNYYTQLLFGGAGRNVADYYREVSRNKLTFGNVGVFGPVEWTNALSTLSDPNDVDSRHVHDVVLLLEKSGFDFRRFDKNNDHVISREELAILAFDNIADENGGTRWGPDNGCTSLARTPDYKVCAGVVFASEQIDFETLTHELSHQSVGTVDLYAGNHNDVGLTLMSDTLQNGPDGKQTVYLDAWHRKFAGWYTPESIGSGRFELGDETWRDFFGTQSRPVWVRNPDVNVHEYFLFEYRDPRGYDQFVADSGVVAWHVL